MATLFLTAALSFAAISSVLVNAHTEAIVAAGDLKSIANNIIPSVLEPDAAGDLDLTFDGDGKVTTDVGTGNDSGSGVAIQADGKIVVVGTGLNGTNNDLILTRYNTDGSLDTSFDGDGKVITAFFTLGDFGNAIAIQPDQKILALGRYQSPSLIGVLARYNPNGTLDPTFGGGDGFTQVSMEATHALALQTDGKILAAGGQATGQSDGNARVQRFNTNGTADTTFGNGIGGAGTSVFQYDTFTGTDHEARAVAVQPDGKIVAGGCRASGSCSYGLVRLNTNGLLDTTFDGDGRVNTAGTGQIEDIVVLTDGDILAIGTLGENFNVTRYNSDGSIDTLFGTGGTGRVSTDFLGSDFAQDGYVQPDGKIVVAGNTGGINGDFGILRYTTAGVLDLTFSNDGKQTIDFNGTGDGAAGAAPDSQGRIVMAGSANAFTLVAVARLLGDDAGPTPTPTPTATPTATPTPGPPASIVGAVTTPSGTAVRGATVFLTDPQGVRRLNLTNSFGFYAFNDVPSGVTYTVSVKSTRFRFTAQQRLITGNTTIDIVGLE